MEAGIPRDLYEGSSKHIGTAYENAKKMKRSSPWI